MADPPSLVLSPAVANEGRFQIIKPDKQTHSNTRARCPDSIWWSVTQVPSWNRDDITVFNSPQLIHGYVSPESFLNQCKLRTSIIFYGKSFHSLITYDVNHLPLFNFSLILINFIWFHCIARENTEAFTLYNSTKFCWFFFSQTVLCRSFLVSTDLFQLWPEVRKIVLRSPTGQLRTYLAASLHSEQLLPIIQHG